MSNNSWILLNSYLMLLFVLIDIKHIRVNHYKLPAHAIKLIKNNSFYLMFRIHMNPKVVIIKESINCYIRRVSSLIDSTSSRLNE